MNTLFAAFRFLSIFPLPGASATDPETLQKSLVYFPCVGLVFGVFASLSTIILQPVFPPLVVAVLLTFILAALSGGLHLDGLADTTDGFFSARPRERILEIMRDSCIGTMGALAIIFVLFLKVSALASMPGEKVWQAVFLMPVAGRCILVIMTVGYRYARTEGGLASPFLNKNKLLPVSIAVLILSTLGIIFSGILMGIFYVLVIVLISVSFGSYCSRKIGGITGDTLGCSCEIAETAVALIYACNFAL